MSEQIDAPRRHPAGMLLVPPEDLARDERLRQRAERFAELEREVAELKAENARLALELAAARLGASAKAQSGRRN